MPETKSRDELITDNLRLVHSLCRRFSGKGIEYDDLFQAGCVGLIKAADGFDEQRGFCFSTYAVPIVLGELKRQFRDGGPVKVSRHLKELNLRINRESSDFERKEGRKPSVSELSEIIGADPEDIAEAVCACRATVSLTSGEDADGAQIDIPESGPEETLADRLLLDGAISCLENNEKKLIKYRYYDGLTQNGTAKLLGMSQVQVSRSEKRILSKLRSKLSQD